MGALIFDADEENFDQAVVQRSFEVPVVIDFWATWCGPCQELGPVLERLVRERNGEVVLAKVDVDRCQALAGHFGIQSIPAVKAIRDGQLVLEFNGNLPEEHLRDFLDRIGPSEAEKLIRQAASVEEKDAAAAEKLYRQAVELEGNNDAARVGLARTLVTLKRFDEVETILEPVGVEGPLGEEAQRIKGMLSLHGLAETAGGDEATLREKLKADPNNAVLMYDLGCALTQKGKHEEALKLLLAAGQKDMKLATTKVREAMVQIFYALGQSHPLSDRYRSELARLLY